MVMIMMMTMMMLMLMMMMMKDDDGDYVDDDSGDDVGDDSGDDSCVGIEPCLQAGICYRWRYQRYKAMKDKEKTAVDPVMEADKKRQQDAIESDPASKDWS